MVKGSRLTSWNNDQAVQDSSPDQLHCAVCLNKTPTTLTVLSPSSWISMGTGKSQAGGTLHYDTLENGPKKIYALIG